MNIKIHRVKFASKRKVKVCSRHPPPPPPKMDQVKFVKPVVAKAAEVTEEPQRLLKSRKKN
jgi:protein TonB